jgi:hypothetical protein
MTSHIVPKKKYVIKKKLQKVKSLPLQEGGENHPIFHLREILNDTASTLHQKLDMKKSVFKAIKNNVLNSLENSAGFITNSKRSVELKKKLKEMNNPEELRDLLDRWVKNTNDVFAHELKGTTLLPLFSQEGRKMS